MSQLEVLVTNACDPSLHEPNYALHLQVADYVNSKKANTPREASMLIARLANHRNPHVAILALSLLDTLVQSCGYPFHLQIATKEFLNELVRRFPERPPPFPGPVMSRILELINGWKDGVCVESRWKEDLGNIRDMWRLLTFKGYRFRESGRRDAGRSAEMNIKSADELENEDREAQSAKLQELIRRGTPRDLAAAQELMKALAGANPEAKPDYRSQAMTELGKLESKVVLLNEMLDNVDAERGEKFASGDVYDQVASVLKSARPKLQKWVSDAETEDPESLNAFLQINDQINTVLNRFEAFKKGDYTVSSNPVPAELAPSLIDFDDSAGGQSSSSNSNPVDDLADIFGASSQAVSTFGSQPQSAFGSPGPSAPPVNHATRPAPSQQQLGSIKLPGTPSPQGSTPQRVTSPNYFGNVPATGPSYGTGNGVGTNSGLGMGMGTSSTIGLANTGATAGAGSRTSAAQGKDPFADLAGLF
ncbi:VHS-domain-containing protein [Leucogyrophana mollusca]|uniref:VHS-domain-containing protein n=1 Tax=Leucogyrophana mollusca TaxID=85980 RepID=A0ACB8BAB6_9AGAM|nr:VHS-domain-containing protein [Leucogyrophana mollusca]